MIANLKRGAGFRGLLNYLCDDAKGFEIVGGNIAGRSARQMASEFAATRDANTAVKTPVWHCSLSSPPGERLSDERWNEIGTALLTKVGLGADRPYVIIRHQDREHDHAHVVTSRTDFAGNVCDGGWEVRRVLKAKAEIETEFGLTPTPVGGAAGPKIGAGHMRRIARAFESGRDLELDPRGTLARHVDDAIRLSGGDEAKFTATLTAQGVAMKLNQSKTTGRVAGARFTLDGSEWLKGSQLGPEYGWRAIQQRIAAITLNPALEHETVGTETDHRAPIGYRAPARVSAEPTRGNPAAPIVPVNGSEAGRNPRIPCRALAFPDFTAVHPAGAGGGPAGVGCSTHHGDQRPRSSGAGYQGSQFLTALTRLPHILSRVARAVSSFADRLDGFFGAEVLPAHKRPHLHGPQLF